MSSNKIKRPRRTRRNNPLVISLNCIEHLTRPATNWHHVIPYSLGGTITVPLCDECHDKAHGVERDYKGFNSSTLIKIGLDAARKRGKKLGRPKLRDDAKIKELRAQGLSIRAIANALNTSTTAVQRGLNN
jgi:hypothetical protein